MNPHRRGGLLTLLAVCFKAGISTVAAGPLAAGQFEDLHHFPEGPPLGEVHGQPFFAADGNLYLAPATGGASGLGSIVRMTARGDISVIHDFAANEGSPNNVALGPDGNYYGTTSSSAIIYQIRPGGQYRLLSGTGSTSPYPMITGPDGALYGVATQGGADGLGFIFRLTTSRQYFILASFSRLSAGHLLGANPNGSLVLGSDNNFYGISGSDDPQVYRVTPAGQITTVAHLPGLGIGGLVKAPDGNLYGITRIASGTATAALFQIDPSGVYTLLSNCPFLEMTPSQLVVGGDGNLYTTGLSRPGSSGYLLQAGAQAWTVVGHAPASIDSLRWLVSGPGGLLYGATGLGGTGNQGILFNLTTTGQQTTLTELGSRLRGPTGVSRGAFNEGAVVGLTEYGGPVDLGTAFEIDTSGLFELVGNFTGPNGSHPQGPPIFSPPYNFSSPLGITRDGGASGRGAVFLLADEPNTILPIASFDESSGQAPDSLAPIPGVGSSIFGTTASGGPARLGNLFGFDGDAHLVSLLDFDATDHPPLKLAASPEPFPIGTLYGLYLGGSQQGKLFQRSSSGDLSQTAQFDSQGLSGVTSLIVAADGNLYGTADNGSGGAIFRLTPAGILTVVSTFETSALGLPDSLVQRPNGDFYGILRGKLPALGSIFRWSAAGELSTVYAFNGDTGSFPNSLTLSDDGNLYGTTRSGSPIDSSTVADGGEVYRLRFGPAVVTARATGISASSAILHGTVDARGAATGVTMTYYPSSSPGGPSGTVAVINLPAASGPVPVSATITGLKPSTYYQYSFSAVNEDASITQNGAQLGFYTRSAVAEWLETQNLSGGVYGDDDRDGVNNLQEYAFGTSPHLGQNTRAAAAGGAVVSHGPPAVQMSAASGGNVAIYARRKDRDFTGLTYTPQVSADLSVWSDVTAAPVVLAADEDFEIVSVSLPAAAVGQSQLFFHLQVTAPE